MSIYDLEKIKLPKCRFLKAKTFWPIILIVFLSSFFGFLAGIFSSSLFNLETKNYIESLKAELSEHASQTSQEKAAIEAVENIWPAVVSIVITKDVPIIEQYFYDFFQDPFQFQIPQYREKGTEKREIGGGTGFIISQDGLILTNKHVVLDKEAEYTVFTNDGKNYSAKVIARDFAMDIAVLKIEQKDSELFSSVKLGDSDNLKPGQTVIAIGTALGEFRNTVSIGVVSGLGRTITASGGGIVETLEDVIQTDAAINMGNSGGPLLNLKGEVIGINTAIALEAQNIGFAIPINQVKTSIEQVKKFGKIVYPFLGVRYVSINKEIQKENNLSVDYGAWIIRGPEGESAIYPDSAAEQAGLKENDIILEFDNKKITTENPLAKIIIEYSPEDKINLKILRNKEEKDIEIILGEKSE